MVTPEEIDSMREARDIQRRIRDARTRWEDAPQAVRDAYFTLSDPLHEHRVGMLVGAYYEVPTGGLYFETRTLTDAERMWCRECVLRDIPRALETHELAREVYEKRYALIQDAQRTQETYAPFAGIVVRGAFDANGLSHSIVTNEAMALVPSAQNLRADGSVGFSKALLSLRTLLRDVERQKLPDPYTPQIDTYLRNPFQSHYRGMGCTKDGFIKLYVHFWPGSYRHPPTEMMDELRKETP